MRGAQCAAPITLPFPGRKGRIRPSADVDQSALMGHAKGWLPLAASFALFVVPAAHAGQTDTSAASRLVLDEPLYTSVPPISDFIQQEPREGEPATEKT